MESRSFLLPVSMPRKAFLLFFAGRDGAIGRKYSCAKKETRSVCLFFSGGRAFSKARVFYILWIFIFFGRAFFICRHGAFFSRIASAKSCTFFVFGLRDKEKSRRLFCSKDIFACPIRSGLQLNVIASTATSQKRKYAPRAENHAIMA